VRNSVDLNDIMRYHHILCGLASCLSTGDCHRRSTQLIVEKSFEICHLSFMAREEVAEELVAACSRAEGVTKAAAKYNSVLYGNASITEH
jgi:hypothetical protein